MRYLVLPLLTASFLCLAPGAEHTNFVGNWQQSRLGGDIRKYAPQVFASSSGEIRHTEPAEAPHVGEETQPPTTRRFPKGLLWLATRVREQLSDIWAEAQSIRRGDKS